MPKSQVYRSTIMPPTNAPTRPTTKVGIVNPAAAAMKLSSGPSAAPVAPGDGAIPPENPPPLIVPENVGRLLVVVALAELLPEAEAVELPLDEEFPEGWGELVMGTVEVVVCPSEFVPTETEKEVDCVVCD